MIVGRNPDGRTGGDEGLTLRTDNLPDFLVGVVNTRNLYWLALAVLVAVFVIVTWVQSSRAGHVAAAVRENELRVRVLGLQPYLVKLLIFVVSAVLVCVIGMVFLLLQSGAVPRAVSADLTITLLVMVVLGGVGSRWGAVIGGVFYTILDQRLTALANSDAVEVPAGHPAGTVVGTAVHPRHAVHPGGALPARAASPAPPSGWRSAAAGAARRPRYRDAPRRSWRTPHEQRDAPNQADGLHTLGRWTTDRSLATPHRVAIDDRGCTLRYSELERRAVALAAGFRAAGYGTGDRIATLTGNSSDHVVAFFACAKAGLVLVPLSWRLSPRELAAQLRTRRTAAAAGRRRPRRRSPPRRAPCCRTGRGRRPLGPGGVERSVPPPTRGRPAARPTARRPRRDVRDDDALLMIFTSGTEGASKAAVLTHANCFWNNLSLSRTLDMGSTDVVLAVLPQFHVGGWNIQPLLAWWVGATVVLERGFDPGRVLQLIAERGVTMLMGVPTQYLMLAEHPDFAQRRPRQPAPRRRRRGADAGAAAADLAPRGGWPSARATG